MNGVEHFFARDGSRAATPVLSTNHDESLYGVAEREATAIGGGGSAAALVGAEAVAVKGE